MSRPHLRQHKKKGTAKPTDITAEKTQSRQNVVDSQQNSQTHGNKTTHDKTNSTHANRNSTHGEKDIFKNRNEESLKQGILGTWNLWKLESLKRAGESLKQGIF